MRRPSHTPRRTCMGCGERDVQGTLLRVTCGADGKLAAVTARQHEGRSGYLHRRAECYTRFAARKGPLRSLRKAVDRAARTAFIGQLQLQDSGVVRG